MLAHLSDLGVQWVRVEFIATGSEIDWPSYDQIVNQLKGAGLNILGLLDNQTLGEPPTAWPTEGAASRFATRATTIANRYKGQIPAWEIWNEEDFGPTRLEPAIYARLLARAFAALKIVDPNNQVIFGGLSNIWGRGSTPGGREYLQAVYRAVKSTRERLGRSPFDAVAVHPYAWNQDPTVYLAQKLEENIRSILRDNGDGTMPLWLTEFGWNSAPDPAQLGPDEARNRMLQADYLKRAFEIVAGLDDVAHAFWFCYQDWSDGVHLQHFGLVNSHLEPKPAYTAYREVVRQSSLVRVGSLTAGAADVRIQAVRWRSSLGEVEAGTRTDLFALAGEPIAVQFTVVNSGDGPAATAGAAPGTIHVPSLTPGALSRPDTVSNNSWRVAIGGPAFKENDYPFRWSLGNPLPPGATQTVEGILRFDQPLPRTWFYAGTVCEGVRWADTRTRWLPLTVLPAPVTIPFLGVYYPNRELTGTPAASRLDTRIAFNWAISPPPGVNPASFSARWLGTLEVARSARYTFSILADDGVRFYIDNALILDEWRLQTTQLFVKAVELTPGPHVLRLEYFQAGGPGLIALTGSD